ncbi:FadR/GntR family transcriptional regulator [Candidimonas nitroreducens]|uniref:GntR family transcriptional regulator n=1 Tax=Candidimonas nitroreducens TaxID=683354 RepID=A0A225MYN4_9BURK|nr:FadR/GntR family transcriptional regulator [Candidimonas nitroreducens]OWT65633.1 GntR family transcriptional regulator [Candidimonas nitroreducens]
MILLASKTSLADAAAQGIQREILDGRWAVGTRIPNEPTLAALLGVSRGTVREAVKMLASQGLLQARQGSGTYVRACYDPGRTLQQMRRATLRDQVETRCALETAAARLAAVRHTPDDLQRLEELVQARGQYYDGETEPGFAARDFAFHSEFVRASHNQALIETYLFFATSVQEIIQATVEQCIPEPGQQAHEDLVRGIASGDPDQAEAAVRRFMAPILDALQEAAPA